MDEKVHVKTCDTLQKRMLAKEEVGSQEAKKWRNGEVEKVRG